MSLDELAGRLSKDDDEVAQVLAMLGDKGFVRRSHSDPTNLRTESPQVAFERIIGQHEQELHRQQEQLSAMRSSAAALVDEYHRTIQNARTGSSNGSSGRITSSLDSLSSARTSSLRWTRSSPRHHYLTF
ncbi:hypothetical protein [Georgenia sp. SUBG003]|uniref:hypothetical protein n=1 Tax=Georgenia sp. SUBG003 TaxID=1497974 RepID=UPI003AB4B5E2